MAKRRKSADYKYWAEDRYWFMGAFKGRLDWICDRCGHNNTTQMRFGQWHLKCSECRNSLIWCFTLKPVGKERRLKITPRDMMPELGPVPRSRPLGYGPSAPVHVVLAEPNTNDTPVPDPDAGLALNPS